MNECEHQLRQEGMNAFFFSIPGKWWTFSMNARDYQLPALFSQKLSGLLPYYSTRPRYYSRSDLANKLFFFFLVFKKEAQNLLFSFFSACLLCDTNSRYFGQGGRGGGKWTPQHSLPKLFLALLPLLIMWLRRIVPAL